jgi:adenine-specific DNA-methyltransferase
MNSNSSLVPLRRHMRHEPTEAEKALWRLLRHRHLAGENFRRQHQIGPYILDFYCLKHGLAVEADGGQHFEPNGVIRDAERTRYLSIRGIGVLRFSNVQVLKEGDAVLEEISRALERPSPCPSPEGEGTRRGAH